MQKFKAESRKVLDLVINSIYSTKEVFLRELISNASDALDKLALSRAGSSADPEPEEPCIELAFDLEARTITVSDNGIGMTAEELEHNLGTIAHSSSLELKRAEEAPDAEGVDIIGQFGVGFYASFMVADRVTVISRAYGSDQACAWESDGIEGFTIIPSKRDGHGTDVILHLRPNTPCDDYGRFLSHPALEELVRRHSNYIRYPIYLKVTGMREIPRPENARAWEPAFEEYTERRILNSMTPIWAKPRSEVTAEEYDSFYMAEFDDAHPPLRTISMHARGGRACDVLLFIPSEPTGDFYSRDFKKGLELYSSGVMVSERYANLLPEYFGFVRGVVDSPDIALSLSREATQSDGFLEDIRAQIDKRLRFELADMRDNERGTYIEFFSNFGRTFKYALYATLGALNETLEDYLLFFTALKDEPVTLREYRESMPENQRHLFFASGDEAGKLEASPSVRAVTERGFDVLLCSESVDEFALMTLREYGNRQFRNVASGDLGIDNGQSARKRDRIDEENRELFDFMRDSLPADVVEVRATMSLEREPACITSAGPISLGMEKYFSSTPDETTQRLRIRHALEINPDHRIFRGIRDAYSRGDAEKVKRYARVLYGQAMIAEGLPVDDVNAYSQAVYSFM